MKWIYDLSILRRNKSVYQENICESWFDLTEKEYVIKLAQEIKNNEEKNDKINKEYKEAVNYLKNKSIKVSISRFGGLLDGN